MTKCIECGSAWCAKCGDHLSNCPCPGSGPEFEIECSWSGHEWPTGPQKRSGYMEDLEFRARACRKWSWCDGMMVLGAPSTENGEGHTFRLNDTTGEFSALIVDLLVRPDFTDAPTRGCLVQLVRDACGDLNVYVGYDGLGWTCYVLGRGISCGLTEVEALVVALEVVSG